MNLEQRIDLLKKLGEFILEDGDEWKRIRNRAYAQNQWFLPEFIDYQARHIATDFLQPDLLYSWLDNYSDINTQTEGTLSGSPVRNIGVVMAGNIPLAGFHDLLCVFLSGHRQLIKPSTKDGELIRGIVSTLIKWRPALSEYLSVTEQLLKGSDAYIATGSNNSSRYFDYYFSKYPHIIRKNRTSAAVLTGNETVEDLQALADDVYLYFGLGCRNVTKIYVPTNYDFLPLLESFKKYNWLAENHKYKNNYDYQLAILLINRVLYMTNGSILLSENKSLFSPISLLHYEVYPDLDEVYISLNASPDIQCIVGHKNIPFGMAQKPAVNEFADKVDTLQFLLNLS